MRQLPNFQAYLLGLCEYGPIEEKSMPLIDVERTYDERCFDLAAVFVEGKVTSPEFAERCHALAQQIQQAIEDWLEANPDSAGGK